MKYLLYFFGLVAVAAIVIAIVLSSKKTDTVVVVPDPLSQKVGPDMCYYYQQKIASGLSDRAWLRINIFNNQVIGEYQNLPAEKDSKVGTFDGDVGPMDPKISARTADVWWNAKAEGTTVTEQLRIQFGEGSAVALFGEMVDRRDGAYVYKDTTKLTPGFQMSQIDCEQMEDMMIVEQYIRSNIKTLAPQKPVLGGSWYVTNVQVMPATKTGTVMYEDGHITGQATFSYTRIGGVVTISNVVKK